MNFPAHAAVPSFDVETIREQFPILRRQIHGRPLVYLDNAASAQKPRAVIDRMTDAMTQSYANVHRGLHSLSNEATTAFEDARKSVARFMNAPSPDEIVFTSGGTDAFNLVAYSLGVDALVEGDEIVLSVMEHHSNIVPWHLLRERKGVVLKWVDMTDDGRIEPEAFRAAFGPRTRLAAVTHMSNVMGALTDARELAWIAHEHGAQILFDGCQASVHGKVDVQELDADFYVMTGHKLYGPSGVGVLYGRRESLAKMVPFRGGGEMIEIVEQDRVTYNQPPHRFEAGTPPILEAIGLGAALEWIMGVGVDVMAAHEAALTERALAELGALDFVTIYGGRARAAPIICFNVDGAHPHDVSSIVDRGGVAIRAGHHCAQPLMKRLGVAASCRASFGVYNTTAEVDALVEGLVKTHKLLG